MQKRNFILSTILIFSLLLVGIYVYADENSLNNPGHSWDEMDCDTQMCVGANVGVGTASPGYKLHVSGTSYVSSNFYAPIMYDANNTDYYLNPNSGSQISTIYANNWFRAQGNTGLYFQDYGGGWYMTDSTWVRAYNSKPVYSPAEIRSGALLRAPSFTDLDNSGYYVNPNGVSKFYQIDAAGYANISGNVVASAGNANIHIGKGSDIPFLYSPSYDFKILVGGGHNLYVRDQNGGNAAALHVNTIYYSASNQPLSSEKYKKDIVSFSNNDYRKILDTLENTNLYSYKWKDKEYGKDTQINQNGTQIGLISEKIPKTFRKGEGYSRDIYLHYVFGGVKALILENEEQEKKIENLEKRIEKLVKSNFSSKNQSFWSEILSR